MNPRRVACAGVSLALAVAGCSEPVSPGVHRDPGTPAVAVTLDAGFAAVADAAAVGPSDAASVFDAGVPVDGAPPALDADTTSPGRDAGSTPPQRVLLFFGPDLAPGPRRRIEQHLRAAAGGASVEVRGPEQLPTSEPEGTRIYSFGDTAVTRALIQPASIAALAPEGFLLAGGAVGGAGAHAAIGRGPSPDTLGQGNLGTSYAAYALLEALGFAFLHPLEPMVPPSLPASARVSGGGAPRWPIRGIQLHTMHPLELTEVLNGFGPGGPEDEAGWRAMLPDWERFLEWSLANRQNRVHWVLLEADAWSAFTLSDVRRMRIAEIVRIAHEYGVAAGADVPLVLHQQHCMRLLVPNGDLLAELAQLGERVDWLMSTGLDYLVTSSGTTELTHPEDTRMLAWMDGLARVLDERHGKRALITAHVSSGQTAPSYIDPTTGQPINFNYLPIFADPRLGLMPHTVQLYGLDDPAPTYGNEDFRSVRELLQREAGRRTVVWHPETAYWVGYDVDLPLFLPLYAERRLHDLRLLAEDESAGRVGRGVHAGTRFDGQLTFSSGWEWSYWLGEVVTARAAYDPMLGAIDEHAAFSAALSPIVAPFGAAAERVRALLIRYVRAQYALLLEGRAGGIAPRTVDRRNGQAYLLGLAASDDLSELGSAIPGVGSLTIKPSRLGFTELRWPIHPPPRYSEIRPLLEEMATTFSGLSQELSALAPEIPAHARPLFDDLSDSAEMLALRATQIFALYDFVAGFPAGGEQRRLTEARDALDRAALVVARRERAYRAPADRIAAWRPNPTAYPFTYLWTVRSLYYWWRDEGKAVDAPRSPCYLNIVNPIDVGFGEGSWVDATHLLRALSTANPVLGTLSECLAEPGTEPVFPQGGLRGRP